jgi:UDP-N-acetylmuramate dehydrogenase
MTHRPASEDALRRVADDLRRLDVGILAVDQPLWKHSTWLIGGPASVWVEPETPEQFARLRQYLHPRDLPSVVIGRGSNLLFADAGVRAVVIRLGRRMSACSFRRPRVDVQAGLAVPRLALRACRRGLSGLEHAAGIPCSVGGLVAMNGGSERQSIGQVIREVTVCDAAGRIETLGPEACGFAYRSSAFQHGDRWVLAAGLTLRPGDPAEIRATMREILAGRRRKFPRGPSCGSVFLSDPDIYRRWGPPGKVIEDTGCKGWTRGRAQVSGKHANFIINTGGARAGDILALIADIRRAVRNRIGREMACEVRYVSEAGRILPAHLAADPTFGHALPCDPPA